MSADHPDPSVARLPEAPRGSVYESTDISWRGSATHVPTATMTMAFSASGAQLVAHAGANYYWFDTEFDVEHLSSRGPTAHTTAVCRPSVAEAETWLVAFLRSGPSWAVRQGRLVLTTDAAQVTLARKEFAASASTSAESALPNYRDPLGIQNAPLRGAASSDYDTGRRTGDW